MKNFTKKIQEQLNIMIVTGKLFRSVLTGNQVWDLYLGSFVNDPKFRDPESSKHNCNHCKNFMRRYGNIIAVDADNKIVSMFDFDIEGEYQNTAKVLSTALTNAAISGVFFETFNELNSLPYESCSKKHAHFQLGVDKNSKRYTKEEAEKFGVVKPNEMRNFDHLFISIPKEFVDQTNNSVESIIGTFRESKEVFKRGMETIPEDTLRLVIDLINQGSLLDGTTHLPKVQIFLEKKIEFDKLSKSEQDNWCWINSYKFHLARFRNELIGVLCTELAEGKELNAACASWNKRVDPANYMKAVAPVTEGMKRAAVKDFIALGYKETDLERRFATMDDIKVSEILHSNVGDGKIKSVSIFDNVKSTSTRHKRSEFDKVEEVDIDKFMKDILPTCSSVEVFLTNDQERNMVTLTTAVHADSNLLFKWNNPYSKTFNGNLAGKSELRDAVAAKGGRVDGVFRFSHSWNELEPNQSLMDLHVFMPDCQIPSTTTHTGGPQVTGRRVGWNNRTDGLSGGSQDVDYTQAAPKGYIPVENITFPSISKMPEGVYTCMIHNWNFRDTGGKGKAEIEFDGNLYQYEYPATKHEQWVMIAKVTLKNNMFTIEHVLEPVNDTAKSKVIYGLDTYQFHKVNLVCLSPNHWGENSVGNKHYMFMLEGCKTPNAIKGFHPEDLNADLTAHRKFLDVLGDTLMIQPGSNQLSGLGFNATVRNEVVVRLKGSHSRVVKLKF